MSNIDKSQNAIVPNRTWTNIALFLHTDNYVSWSSACPLQQQITMNYEWIIKIWFGFSDSKGKWTGSPMLLSVHLRFVFGHLLFLASSQFHRFYNVKRLKAYNYALLALSCVLILSALRTFCQRSSMAFAQRTIILWYNITKYLVRIDVQ